MQRADRKAGDKGNHHSSVWLVRGLSAGVCQLERTAAADFSKASRRTPRALRRLDLTDLRIWHQQTEAADLKYSLSTRPPFPAPSHSQFLHSQGPARFP